ncbi:MAG TPA: hypothetical protein PLD88_08785 [Candidatus Berkiella sp.]|nr:hypothetical protein [Candidatus Berkiella sp.]
MSKLIIKKGEQGLSLQMALLHLRWQQIRQELRLELEQYHQASHTEVPLSQPVSLESSTVV